MITSEVQLYFKGFPRLINLFGEAHFDLDGCRTEYQTTSIYYVYLLELTIWVFVFHLMYFPDFPGAPTKKPMTTHILLLLLSHTHIRRSHTIHILFLFFREL